MPPEKLEDLLAGDDGGMGISRSQAGVGARRQRPRGAGRGH